MADGRLEHLIVEWSLAKMALERIAGLGMDAPPAMERGEFHRDQLMQAIGKASRTLALMAWNRRADPPQPEASAPEAKRLLSPEESYGATRREVEDRCPSCHRPWEAGKLYISIAAVP